MPSIMSLEGPNLGRLKPTESGRLEFFGPGSTQLLGPVDTVKAHPWAAIVGLVLGGYLSYRGFTWPDVGKVWGAQHADRSRTRAMHGTRRRR